MLLQSTLSNSIIIHQENNVWYEKAICDHKHQMWINKRNKYSSQPANKETAISPAQEGVGQAQRGIVVEVCSVPQGVVVIVLVAGWVLVLVLLQALP